MRQKALGKESITTEANETWDGEEWTVEETYVYAALNSTRHLIVIDSFVVDVTGYLKEHVSRVTERAYSDSDLYWKAGGRKAIARLHHSNRTRWTVVEGCELGI